MKHTHYKRRIEVPARQADRRTAGDSKTAGVVAAGEAQVVWREINAGIMLGWEAGRELAGAAAEIEKLTPADIPPWSQLARDQIFLATKPVFDDPP